MQDETTPQDDKAMPPTSLGSVAGDIVERLLRWGYSADPSTANDLMGEAAAEIERRRLTASERAAIRFAAGEAAAIAEQNPTSKFWPDHAVCLRSAAERLG